MTEAESFSTNGNVFEAARDTPRDGLYLMRTRVATSLTNQTIAGNHLPT